MPGLAWRRNHLNIMNAIFRTTAWAVLIALTISAQPTGAEQRFPIDQRHGQDWRRDHRSGHDAADAAAGFLGLFLGLLGGLQDQPEAQPGCDPAAFYGWAQTRHPTFGYGLSYPSHWQQPQIGGDPNIVQILLNPCPPHAAVIVARSAIGHAVNQQQLEAVMNEFRKEGGVFARILSQEPVAAAGQPRRKGLFKGSDNGVEMAALVHLVSTPTEIYLVVGIVPDAAGERVGTMMRFSIESFVPLAALPPGG